MSFSVFDQICKFSSLCSPFITIKVKPCRPKVYKQICVFCISVQRKSPEFSPWLTCWRAAGQEPLERPVWIGRNAVSLLKCSCWGSGSRQGKSESCWQRRWEWKASWVVVTHRNPKSPNHSLIHSFTTPSLKDTRTVLTFGTFNSYWHNFPTLTGSELYYSNIEIW